METIKFKRYYFSERGGFMLPLFCILKRETLYHIWCLSSHLERVLKSNSAPTSAKGSCSIPSNSWYSIQGWSWWKFWAVAVEHTWSPLPWVIRIGICKLFFGNECCTKSAACSNSLPQPIDILWWLRVVDWLALDGFISGVVVRHICGRTPVSIVREGKRCASLSAIVINHEGLLLRGLSRGALIQANSGAGSWLRDDNVRWRSVSKPPIEWPARPKGSGWVYSLAKSTILS